MEDRLNRLENQLHRIEEKATEDARILQRKLSAEAYRVEGYRKGAERAKGEAEQARSKGRFLRDAGAALERTLRGLEGRHAAARRARDERRAALLAARREAERLASERAREHERLEGRMGAFRAQWRELYEGRHGKRPHVQQRERAQEELRGAEERLRETRSRLREAQADIFKAKCERGRRNAEESGFYPLPAFLMQVARLGAETWGMEAEEARIQEHIQRRLTQPPEPPHHAVESSPQAMIHRHPNQLPDESVRHQYPPESGRVLQPLHQKNDQQFLTNRPETGLPVLRQLLQESAEESVIPSRPTEKQPTERPSGTRLSTNMRSRFERLKLYTPMFSSPPSSQHQPPENKPRMRLFEAFKERVAARENIPPEKRPIETPLQKFQARVAPENVPPHQKRVDMPPSVEKRPLATTDAAISSVMPPRETSNGMEERSPHFSDGLAGGRGEPKRRYVDIRFEHVEESRCSKTAAESKVNGRVESPALFGSWDDRPPSRNDLKSPAKRDNSGSLDEKRSWYDLKSPSKKTSNVEAEAPSLYGSWDNRWKSPPSKMPPVRDSPHKRPLESLMVAKKVESSFESKRVKVSEEVAKWNGEEKMMMEEDAVGIVVSSYCDASGTDVSTSGAAKNRFHHYEVKDVFREGAKKVVDVGAKNSFRDDQKDLFHDGEKNIVPDEAKYQFRNEAKDMFRNEAKDMFRNEAKDMFRNEAKDMFRNEGKEDFHAGAKNIIPEEAKYQFRNEAKDIFRNEAKDVFRNDSKEVFHEGAKNIISDEAKYQFRNKAKDVFRNEAKEVFTEGAKNIIHDEAKYQFRNEAKEVFHEGAKNIISDEAQYQFRNAAMDMFRNEAKDKFRNEAKEVFNEGAKSSFPTGAENIIREGPKDVFREGPKDTLLFLDGEMKNAMQIEQIPTSGSQGSRKIEYDGKATEAPGVTDEVSAKEGPQIRISDEEKVPEESGNEEKYFTPGSQTEVEPKEATPAIREDLQGAPPMMPQRESKDENEKIHSSSSTMPDNNEEKMPDTIPEKDLAGGTFDTALLESPSVGGSSSGQYQTAPCSSRGSSSKGVEGSAPSPFDFERHMKALEAIKASPGFTYTTRKMYEEGGANLDPSFFQPHPSAAVGKPPPSPPPKEDFLSFAFDDYLADSPAGGSPVRGVETSLFGGGGDSSPASQAKSPPPLFPMFGGGGGEKDEDKEESGGFFFSFAGGEDKATQEETSGFKFAF